MSSFPYLAKKNMTMALRRLQKDLDIVFRDKLSDFSVLQNAENPYILHCTICPHNDSTHGGKQYTIVMIIPPTYPMQCPLIRFEGRVNHQCVDTGGELLLQWDWSPAYTISTMLLAICSYFNDHDLTKGRQIERATTYKEELVAYVWGRNGHEELLIS